MYHRVMLTSWGVRTRAATLLCAWLVTVALAQNTVISYEQRECTGATVATTAGAVCGMTVTGGSSDVEAFLGIPFAESTAGDNRFEPPVAKSEWDGVFAATAYGPACPQSADIAGRPESEDCLTINVWRPIGAVGPRPVLFFVHGGAFVQGSVSDPVYSGSSVPLHDGAYLAASQGVVVVMPQYRLGVLGAFGGIADRPVNYGMLDQQMALRWVQDNIAAFGGNPGLVTLAGESAGAMSVGLHLYSMPSSEGLFQAAIMQSNPFGIPYKTAEQAAANGGVFMTALRCRNRADQLACLKAAPLDSVLAAASNPYLSLAVLEQRLSGFLNWAPIVDGELIVGQPVDLAISHGTDLPVLLGTNTNEGTVFMAGDAEAGPISDYAYSLFISTMFGSSNLRTITGAYPTTGTGDNRERVIEIANDYIFQCANRAVAQAATGPTYYYQYDHAGAYNLFPGVARCADEACHGDELPFLFHTGVGDAAFTPDEEVLATSITAYWGRFVGGLHNPSLAGLERWPDVRVDGAYQVLAVPITTATLDRRACQMWDALGYPIEENLSAQ